MRKAANILAGPRFYIRILVVYISVLIFPLHSVAEQVSLVLPAGDGTTVVETGLFPAAFGSDSIYCGERLLIPDSEYTYNYQNGRLNFLMTPPCDSVHLSAFRIPQWLVSPAGNRPPPGRRLLDIDADLSGLSRPSISPSQKITLSGSKSFAFIVGRSGEGTFSQGLNLDFDARVADDLRLRGSVSDRAGSENQFLAGEGGTLILSELDKYFFEIESRRIFARGGDITATQNRFLPEKRLKGIHAAYAGPVDLAVDLGRPAGRFVTKRISGVDGRQGPYQAVGPDGLPTGIVPGSEKVYVDGRALEAGADKHYFIDYPSGRITFSPRVLITSRSRIELDFEAASGDYEQIVYGGAGELKIKDKKFKFSVGARRETDDEDKLRFGSFSAAEIEILRQAGDRAELAFADGAIPDTAGDYQLSVDGEGNEYYRYVGSDSGDYSVSFSFVGEGEGDYRYLGDGIYQFAGINAGAYKAIRFLTLPVRNDFVYSALEVSPYAGGLWQIEFQGNDRDNNLLSGLDDGDNFRGQYIGRMAHERGRLSSQLSARFRQALFTPVYRIDPPDDNRRWALPPVKPTSDELRLNFENNWKTPHNRIGAEYGFVDFRKNLRSHRVFIQSQLLDDKPLSPRLEYQTANSQRSDSLPGDGLYEKYGGGLSIKPVRQVRFELNYDRELVKDRYDSIPAVEKYRKYQAAVFIRRTVLTVSRRIEYQSGYLGYRGPLQDKVELSSDETFGRLQVSLAGTWFRQEKIDSYRDDRTERLFITGFRYSPASGWLTIQAEYRQNRQNVRSAGYRYIKVNSGEGEYRYEDGRYLPDPDGDYIRIREERGEAASVSTGEKNHNMTFYPGRFPGLKRYQAILSQFALRLRTEVIEEMPGGDRRTLSWILPWTSRSGIDYIRRLRREKYTGLLFPAFNFYILSVSYGSSFEEQESGAELFRSEKDYEVELKNRISPTVLTRIDGRKRFKKEFGIGAVSMELTRDIITAGLVINPIYWQITPEVSYLRFTDRQSEGEGHGVMLGLEVVRRQLNLGEIRLNTELRSLTEKIAFSQPEYLITDGMRFGRSALVNLVVNYQISKLWRLTVNLTDKIYEKRPAEFVGRGELIARF